MTEYTWYIPNIQCTYVQDTILHIPTILRIIMMFPWKTCGTPVPNSFSPVPFVRKMDGALRIATYKTGPDDTMYSFVFFSTSTFEVLDLPIKLDQRAYGGHWSDQTV